jgi:hypothetical protein
MVGLMNQAPTIHVEIATLSPVARNQTMSQFINMKNLEKSSHLKLLLRQKSILDTLFLLK